MAMQPLQTSSGTKPASVARARKWHVARQAVGRQLLPLVEDVVVHRHSAQHEPVPPVVPPPASCSTVSLSLPHSSAAKQLTSRIKACTDWHQLRVLLTVQAGGDINPVHVTAAVHHCSMVTKHTMSASERSSLKQWLNSSILPAAVRLQRGMGPRELVTILHALASMLHVPPVRWLAAHCKQMDQVVDSYTIRDTASSLWALSRLLRLAKTELSGEARRHTGRAAQVTGPADSAAGPHQYEAVLAVTQQAAHTLLAHSLSQLHLANSQDLANLVLSAATLYQLGVVLDPPRRQLPGANGHAAAHADLHWSSHVTHASQPLSWASWKAAVLAASQPKLHSCTPHALANIAHGLSQLSSAGPQPSDVWRAAFSTAASQQLHSFCPQALVAVLSAHVSLGWQGDSSWARQLIATAQTALPECSPQDLCDLGLAVPVVMGGQAGRRGGPASCWLPSHLVTDWCRAYETSVADRLRHASPQQCALLLYSLAKAWVMLQWQPSRHTLTTWFSTAHSQLHHFSTLDAAQVLAACCSLCVSPPPDIMQALVHVLRQGLPSCQLSQVSTSLRSLAKLRYNPGWQFMLDLYNHTATQFLRASTQQQLGNTSGRSAAAAQHHHHHQMVSALHWPATQPVQLLGPHSVEGLLSRSSVSGVVAQQGSHVVDVRDVSCLVGGIAALDQRPLQSWASALLEVLPQVLARAALELQHTSTAAGASRVPAVADCLVTLAWGLLRSFIVPTFPVLHHMLTANTAAVPHLAAGRASLLLVCMSRLMLNAAAMRSAAAQAGMSRRRRAKLLAVNWVQRSTAPGTTGGGHSNTEHTHTEQQEDHQSRAAHQQLHVEVNRSVRHRLRLIGSPKVKSLGLARQPADAPGSHQQQAAHVPGQVQAGMTQLLSAVLQHCSPQLEQLSCQELSAAVKGMRTATRVASLAAPHVQSQLAAWLVAWLQQHSRQVLGGATGSAGVMDWGVVGAVAHLVHVLGVQPEVTSSSLNRHKRSGATQAAAAGNEAAGSHPVHAQLQHALCCWLGDVLMAARSTAGHTTCPVVQLPALVRLGQVCGQVQLVQSCVQDSLLAHQEQLLQQAQHKVAVQRPRSKRGQRVAGRKARLGLLPPATRLLGPVTLLQLGHAVVACDAARQQQCVVAAAALCVCLQKVLSSQQLNGRLRHHHAHALGVLVRRLQPCQEQARSLCQVAQPASV